MMIECDLQPPEGYEIVRYGIPQKGELYLTDDDTVSFVHRDFVEERHLIVKKLPVTFNELKIGEKFKLEPENTHYMKVDLPISILNTSHHFQVYMVNLSTGIVSSIPKSTQVWRLDNGM